MLVVCLVSEEKKNKGQITVLKSLQSRFNNGKPQRRNSFRATTHLGKGVSKDEIRSLRELALRTCYGRDSRSKREGGEGVQSIEEAEGLAMVERGDGGTSALCRSARRYGLVLRDKASRCRGAN